MFGARVSLVIGGVSVGLALVGGVPIGLAAGFAGGWLDRLTMRVVDILVSFPTILLAIIVITIFGPGLRNAMIAIGIAQVPLYARLTRGAVLKVKALDYVLAARASGARESRVLWRHVVPNCLPPLLVQSTLLLRHRHPVRRLPRLPRPGRAAADGGVGNHAGARRATFSAWLPTFRPSPA